MKSFLFLWLPLAAVANDSSVDLAFQQLYNFEFAASVSTARGYTQAKQDDTLGYAALAASHLFSEMNRLEVFNKDMLKEEKIQGDQAKRIGAEAKRNFEDALNRAKNAGAAALAKNPNDVNALLGLAIATGAERDFAALVEKRLKDSYYAAKASQEYALRLQKVDASVEDAWFTRGFSEYLVGSVPFVIRWMMRIDDVTGDKKKGVEYMERCARNGKYLKPFAQMMLATVYQKEKRWADTRRMLEAFAKDHPENKTVQRELAKLPRS
jgi:hypothetical protein